MHSETSVLIQITDTHLIADKNESLRGVNTYDSLMSVLDQAEKQLPRADAYLVTGDLSHDGSQESYSLLKECLTRLKKPVYVIPGNHDDPDTMRGFLLADHIRYPTHTDLGAWRLIFLDTHVAGEEYGLLDEGELQKLTASLAAGPLNHLVCIHHPAIRLGSAWIDRSMLRNPEALFDATSQASGKLVILCGHAHQEYVEETDGLTLMGTPSTCTQFKPGTAEFQIDEIGPGFRIVELHDSGAVDTRVVRLCADNISG